MAYYFKLSCVFIEQMIVLDFFELTLTDYNYIVKECMLDEDYQKLLKMKIQEWTRPKMADELHVSVDTLDKMIAKLKKKIKKIL